jgi:hypothetical protein
MAPEANCFEKKIIFFLYICGAQHRLFALPLLPVQQRQPAGRTCRLSADEVMPIEIRS